MSTFFGNAPHCPIIPSTAERPDYFNTLFPWIVFDICIPMWQWVNWEHLLDVPAHRGMYITFYINHFFCIFFLPLLVISMLFFFPGRCGWQWKWDFRLHWLVHRINKSSLELGISYVLCVCVCVIWLMMKLRAALLMVCKCRCNACVAARMSVCDNKQIVISTLAVN